MLNGSSHLSFIVLFISKAFDAIIVCARVGVYRCVFVCSSSCLCSVRPPLSLCTIHASLVQLSDLSLYTWCRAGGLDKGGVVGWWGGGVVGLKATPTAPHNTRIASTDTPHGMARQKVL